MMDVVATRTNTRELSQRIADIARRPASRDLVAAYFDPNNGFAGAMFDGLDDSRLLSNNPADEFTADDIAAASLLDVRFGPAAVRTLLSTAEITKALAAVPTSVSLWEATDSDLEVASRLWALVRKIDGVGRTRASKLLARKRPDIVPIIDSVIAAAMNLGRDTWRPLAEVLQDENLRGDLEGLRPSSVSPQLSVLRLLDVVIWMSFSRSTSAVRWQHHTGAETTRDLPVRLRR